MTKGSPMKLLSPLPCHCFWETSASSVYNLADTSIAGHLLGDAALAQIGATPRRFNSLITNFAFGLNNGLALNVSPKLRSLVTRKR